MDDQQSRLNPSRVRIGLDGTRRFIRDVYAAVQAGAKQGQDLRTVYKRTLDAVRPTYGHWVIFDHCMPFDVSRAYDEAKGIKKFYTFSHPELQDQFPRYLPELLAWKKRLKIHTSLIVPGEYKNQIAAKYPSYIADEYRETRFLPSEFPFRGTMMLAAEKVAIFSMIDDEVYAVTIESPIMVNMLKQVFLFTWDMIGKR